MNDLSPFFDALPALPIAAIGAKVLTDAAALSWPASTSGKKGAIAFLLALAFAVLWMTLQSPSWDVQRAAEAALTGLLAWAVAVGVTELHRARVVAGAQSKIEAGKQ